LRCGGEYCVRVELQVGAMRYVELEEAERLVATGNFEEEEPEGSVRVLRELPPPGWVRPPTDTTSAMLCEDVFRKRQKTQEQLAELSVAARYEDGVCTCGAGEGDWCDYCRGHCVECGLPRSHHPIDRMEGRVVAYTHHFVGVGEEIVDAEWREVAEDVEV
jgi:hypothetical protein